MRLEGGCVVHASGEGPWAVWGASQRRAAGGLGRCGMLRRVGPVVRCGGRLDQIEESKPL